MSQMASDAARRLLIDLVQRERTYNGESFGSEWGQRQLDRSCDADQNNCTSRNRELNASCQHIGTHRSYDSP